MNGKTPFDGRCGQEVMPREEKAQELDSNRHDIDFSFPMKSRQL